jgi:RNA polymerase sigma-70 factor (ECF subfamily)
VTHPRARAGAEASPDPELVSRVAARDLRALGELYDRYSRDVWRAARRALPGGADVDDVVHATFLKLPEIASSYDGRTSCRAWLCGVAVRLALRHQRGRERFGRMLTALSHVVAGRHGHDPERRASHREELVRFERALARLSAKKRAVFVLVEIEGLTSDEAAAALEVPPATVRTRLFHARRELHDVLGDLRGGGERP